MIHKPLRRSLAWIALALLLPGMAGCALGPSHLEIPLFFEYDPDPVEGGEWTSLPLLLSGYESKPANDEERYYGLFPLFHSVREGRERSYYLGTVPYYREVIDHRGFKDIDVLAGPVMFGDSADEGSYLAVLPVGGELKGFLGKDYAAFATPFFWYLEENTSAGLFKSYHAPFPFFNYVTGGGRSGFRVWPLYGHYQRHDAEGNLAYDRRWIMWPFWSMLRNNINTGQGEQWTWFLFPFVGRGGGPHHSQFTVMWPLFHYFETDAEVGAGPYWQLRVLFPFFIYANGKNQYRFDMWPFFGFRERFRTTTDGERWGFRRHFVLFPTFRMESYRSENFESDMWWLLPLLWKYEYRYPLYDEESYTFKIWPLLRYKEHRDGRVTVNVISPLWFDDPLGAWEHIYNPLTRVYERDTHGDKDHLRLLWGLYDSYEDARRDDFAIHPLFWDDELKDDSEHNFGLLFGLFQYKRRGDHKALRLFWLPEWPSWGGDDPADQPAATTDPTTPPALTGSEENPG